MKTSFYKKIVFYIIFLSCGTLTQAQLLTFQLYSQAASTCGPHMNGGIYAFKNFYWDASSSASATAENMTSVDGTVGLSYTSGTSSNPFRLTYFNHINVVDPNGSPTTAGQRGDYRIYSDGTITIKNEDATKLVLTNCLSEAKVSYPVALSGPGDAISGSGWGTIDNLNSDPAWVAEFDANGTGQVYIEYTSVSNVVQNYCYNVSRYNFTINLYPSNFERTMLSKNITAKKAALKNGGYGLLNTTVDFSEINLSFDFSSFTAGGSGGDQTDVYAEFRSDNPGGNKPTGINTIGGNGYWTIGTTLAAFNTSITFDLSSYGGITNMNDIRILRREASDANWVIAPNQSMVGNTIVCTNVTEFSQWAPGSTGADPLPVELTSFIASAAGNNVNLKWQTATEVNNYGFEVERTSPRPSPLQGEGGEAGRGWETLGFVNGAGNSNSVKEYSFVDKPIGGKKYKYRLKQIDNNGRYEYSNEVEVDLEIPNEFSLAQNYPNPFNPSTAINYSIPVDSRVKLLIYSVTGELVKSLVDEYQTAGFYTAVFDATGLASGIYFYKLTADNFTQIKKMAALK